VKTLVVYYSLTGNTKYLAGLLKQKFKADVEELFGPYKNKLNAYTSGCKDVIFKKLIEIGEQKKNPENYNLICIATPVWAFNLTAPVRSYMVKHSKQLAGKKVMLFCTNEGTEGKTLKEMEGLLPECKIVKKISFNFGKQSKEEIKNKIKELKA
jgi:flavodoxin